jgi:ATP-binding cassette subfamily B protein RaxB
MFSLKKEKDNTNDEIIRLINCTGNSNVPLILQAEVSECGLACIAMISSYHGHKINIQPLRKKFNLDINGLTLKRMMEISSELGLCGRAIKCPLEEIGNLTTPCVLHWDMQHFVVLTKVTSKFIYINDPAIGKRRISIDDFSDSFTGIALELIPTSSFSKENSKITMRLGQLWSKFSGFKRSLATLFSLSLILQCIALLSPYYMQWVIDHVLITHDKPLLIALAAGFFILIMIRVIISSFRSWLVLKLSSLLSLQMGSNLFHHLLRLPISFFEKRHIGDIVSKFGSFTVIRQMLTTGLVEALIDGVMALVVVFVIYTYSPMLTLIIASSIIMSFIIQLLFFYPLRRITQESIIFEAKEDTIFLESIGSIQAIKLFSQQVNRQNSWLNSYADVINANIRIGKLGIAEDSISSTLSGLEYIMVIYFGALLVIDGELTVGMLLAFIAYKDQFSSSIHSFINKYFSYKMLGLHLERLSDIALEKKEDTHGVLSNKQLNVKGAIRLEKISYRYSEQSDWIIKDFNLEINPGESVAITGPSGCGKTTLLKIILGLIKPTSGKVFIDNISIDDIGLDSYRRVLGTVMQNDTLFSGTIIENITMFEPQYDEDRLSESSRLACILDDINKLPMGFYSLVTHTGNNFSGGQFQRLLLARALYKKPKVLCLDESTSHLDTVNERLINENMKSLSMTRIIIAHRKETISSADRVIKLKHIDN